MKRAAIYCRISRDPGHDEKGVRRQEADCRQLCQRDGIEVVEVLVDDDVSAYNKKHRPGYERLLELLRSGEINAVVAWHPDRLTRHPRELEDLIDTLNGAKATVRTVQAGEYDLSSSTGRTVARIVGAVARGESEHKADRLRRKHDELAEQGRLSGGGTRPYGYNDDRLTINEDEAKIIREAATRVLAGDSLRSIAVDLTRRGVPTVSGKRWKTQVLRTSLMSARIAGLRDHRSGTFPASWPAIISVDDHRRLVAVLGDPSRRVMGPGRRYLLTGVTTCAWCGAKLIARPRTDRSRSMVCATGTNFIGCGKIRVLAEPLEELVTEAVLTRLDSPALAQMLDRPDIDDGAELEELARLDARRLELGEMWAQGEIDRASWAAALRRLDADIEAISAKVRRRSTANPIARSGAAAGGVRASWPDLHIDRQRAIIAATVASVVVGPAVRGRNTFDPSRVSINWKV